MRHAGSLFEDVLKLGESLLTAALDSKKDLKQEALDRIEIFANRFDLVRREEMDALRGMLAKARDEQDELRARLEVLEKSAPKKGKPASKKGTKATKTALLKKKNTRPKTLRSVKQGNQRKPRKK